MTRYTKIARKTHEEATGWKGFQQIQRPKEEGKKSRSDARRRRRIRDRDEAMVCFGCRQHGHSIANCPRNQEENGGGICYKCGSSEHNTTVCRKRIKSGPEFPFAVCFICKEKGHLSKSCPDNPRGLYPNGGCCKICQSVEHYAKDCPENLQQKKSKKIRLPMLVLGESADAQVDEGHSDDSGDDDESVYFQKPREVGKKPTAVKRKVVVF